MRNLATIKVIEKLEKHPNADLLEIATIKGWKVIVKKDEFKEKDWCVYFEIDSFLPIKPEYEFLRKGCYKKLVDGTEGFRLRTIKLRGCVSQGLALPIPDSFEDIGIDDDISETLGVIKYEPPTPAQLVGLCRGNFPSFIKKTDQERIQNCWKEINRDHKDILFEVSLKLDGTSATYYYKDGELGYCSRNMELKMDSGNTYNFVGTEKNIFTFLKSYGKNIALQGEIIGEGIQGNKENIRSQDFYLFDIFDIDNFRYLTPNERMDIVNDFLFKSCGIKHIPIYGDYKITDFNTIDELLEFAKGKSLNSDIREGVVLKYGDISFKVINNDFLIKYQD